MNIAKIIHEHYEIMIEKGFFDCPECKDGYGRNPKWKPGDSGHYEWTCTRCEGTSIDQNKNIGELLMLIITELGEALEAHRCGRFADISMLIGYPLENYTYPQWEHDFKNFVKDTFEDEIADVFLRLFALCGYLRLSKKQLSVIDHQFRPSREGKVDSENIGESFFIISHELYYFYKKYKTGSKFYDGLAMTFRKLWCFCQTHNIPIEKHIAAKMKYNKTRPIRNGKVY